MFATAIAARLDRAGVHYGLVIVAVTFVTLLTTAGAMGLPGALILSLNKEFGWDTGEISSALALRLALFGLMGPFSAALIERFGLRKIVLIAVLLITGGLLGVLNEPGGKRQEHETMLLLSMCLEDNSGLPKVTNCNCQPEDGSLTTSAST
jgi:MFS family permease